MKNTEQYIEWFSYSDIPFEINALEASWLYNEESLTKRLTELSEQRFSIDVLLEGWQSLRTDETLKLEMSHEKKGWVREVFLKGDNKLWVYARSVSMQTSLNNQQYDLTTIGKKSLGSILFANEYFKRTSLEVTHYPMCLLPLTQTHALSFLWGRRSRFVGEEVSVLVQEVFLPDFWQKLQHQKSD